MKLVRLVTLFLAALGIGLFLCSTPYAAPVIMKVTVGTPENHFQTERFAEWGKLVEQNSKGEIKVQMYHSAQLFRANEAVKAIQTGAIDAGEAFAMYMENQLIPGMKVLQMPFLFKSLEEALMVMHSDIGEAWKKAAEQKGIKLLAIVSYPSPEGEGLCTIKLAKVPADVKGMVLRTVGPELGAMMKKWGAGPSFLTGAEVYMGLQRGTLQGTITSYPSFVERKFYEVAPYMVMLPYASVQVYIAINKAFFDRLTPFQQKAIVDAANSIDKSNYDYTMTKVLKPESEAAKKLGKIYFPTTAELALWTAGKEDVWAETAKPNKDVAETLQKVRDMLKR